MVRPNKQQKITCNASRNTYHRQGIGLHIFGTDQKRLLMTSPLIFKLNSTLFNSQLYTFNQIISCHT